VAASLQLGKNVNCQCATKKKYLNDFLELKINNKVHSLIHFPYIFPKNIFVNDKQAISISGDWLHYNIVSHHTGPVHTDNINLLSAQQVSKNQETSHELTLDTASFC